MVTALPIPHETYCKPVRDSKTIGQFKKELNSHLFSYKNQYSTVGSRCTNPWKLNSHILVVKFTFLHFILFYSSLILFRYYFSQFRSVESIGEFDNMWLNEF